MINTIGNGVYQPATSPTQREECPDEAKQKQEAHRKETQTSRTEINKKRLFMGLGLITLIGANIYKYFHSLRRENALQNDPRDPGLDPLLPFENHRHTRSGALITRVGPGSHPLAMVPLVDQGNTRLKRFTAREMHLQENLTQFIRFGGIEDLEQLLETREVDVNIPDQDGFFPLHWAVQRGSRDMVKLLLKHGAKVDNTDNYGSTPLHWAFSLGDTETQNVLLQDGANINVRNLDGFTPPEFATQKTTSLKRPRE